MKRPSPHFTWDELACNDGTPYPEKWRQNRLIVLLNTAEDLRTHLGSYPLIIGSAYRTPRWNRLQGGASSSQHVQGCALDPQRPRYMRLKTMHQSSLEFARNDERVGGIGLYVWGIHLDIRARKHGRFVVWNQVPAGTAMHDI